MPVPLLTSALGLPGVVVGESFGSAGSFGIAVISLITMILGYGLLLVLWLFVFREKPAEKAARRNRVIADEREAALRAAGHPDNPGARHNDDRVDADGLVADESLPRHGRPLKIEPRPGPRFRRR